MASTAGWARRDRRVAGGGWRVAGTIADRLPRSRFPGWVPRAPVRWTAKARRNCGLGIVNALRCDRLAAEGRQDLAAAGASGARTGGVGG